MSGNKHIFNLFLFSLLFLASSSRSWAQSLARQGWPASLKELYSYTQSTQKSYVLLVSRLPSIVLDFRSNQGLRNSINTFNFQRDYHPGHEMIGWSCQMNGSTYTSFIGFSGESNNQSTELLNKGWGLTSLLATFTDGYIQTPNDLEERFQYFNEEFEKNPKGPFYLIANLFEITTKDCESLIREVYRYTSNPEKPTTKFGLLVDPKKNEGAGCGSFAIHFFEKVKAFENISEQFKRHYKMPYYLFGKGEDLPDSVSIPESIQRITYNEKVSKVKLISYDWSPSSDLNLEAQMVDPELVIFWQKKFFEAFFKNNKKLSNFDYNFFRKKTKRGHWELIDDIYNNGQAQSKYIEIDDNYDFYTQSLAKRAINDLQGKKLIFFKFLNFPGMIVENN